MARDFYPYHKKWTIVLDINKSILFGAINLHKSYFCVCLYFGGTFLFDTEVQSLRYVNCMLMRLFCHFFIIFFFFEGEQSFNISEDATIKVRLKQSEKTTKKKKTRHENYLIWLLCWYLCESQTLVGCYKTNYVISFVMETRNEMIFRGECDFE